MGQLATSNDWSADQLQVLGMYMPAEWWVEYLHELACMGKYDTLLQYLTLARRHQVIHLLQEAADRMKVHLCYERKLFSDLWSGANDNQPKRGKRCHKRLHATSSK